MSYNTSDAAEQVVRMSMDGAEVALRVAGKGAEKLAVLLYAILKDQKRTKGKIRLANLLRSGKELKVFAVRDRDLQKFCTEAKKYGVLYTVLKDRDADDGLTDIMVRAEDASKINRIFERFGLATVDMGSVKTQIEQNRANREEAVEPPERPMTREEKIEAFLDDILTPNPTREEQQTANPMEGRIARSRQSEPSSEKKWPTARDAADASENRPSVRKQLEEIRKEQRKTAKASRHKDRTNEHIPPGKKRIQKEDKSR